MNIIKLFICYFWIYIIIIIVIIIIILFFGKYEQKIF